MNLAAMQNQLRKGPHFPLLCLLLVSAGVILLNPGNTHLWDQDEGYYAATAAEMYARNDWITPTFNGNLFAHKPPMMFWGMMIGYRAFGISEQGARLVSGLFGMGTVFLTFAIGRKLFDTATGLFAGLAIGACVTFTMIARSATADAHLTFFTVLALYLWCRDAFHLQIDAEVCIANSVRWRTWVVTYAAMGLAVLTKGPIGFLFPTAVIGLFLLSNNYRTAAVGSPRWQRLWAHVKPYSPPAFFRTVWSMKPITAAMVVLLIASPWYLAVQWRTQGEFLREFIGVHHLGRMSQAMDNHSGPWYYYLVACLIGMYPWSAFAIPTLIAWIGQLRTSAQSRSARFVTCWVAVYLVIFSIASTKLPNYVVPAYPALAIVIGRYFALWTRDVSCVNRSWLYAGWALLIAVGAFLSAGIPIAGLLEFGGQTLLDRTGMERVLQSRFAWFGIAGVPLVVFGAIGLSLLRAEKPQLSGASFALGAVTMILILCQFVAPGLDRFQSAQLLAERWSPRLPIEKSEIAVLGYFRPTMVFYFGRDIEFCDTDEDAIRIAERGGNSILVTTDKHYAKIKGRLPDSTEVIERVSQFPNRGEVLVLGDRSLKR
jgi:4-amino-4-deoxy-L-arabinose transferase-like glycosyltransferase